VRYVHTTGKLASSVVHADPEPLPEGHVRLTVAYVGVCHSDLAAVAEGEGDFPRRLGHEVSGVVTESEAADRPPGTRVAAHVSDGYASEIIVPAARTVVLHPDCSLLDGALAEPVACVIGGLEMLSFREYPRIVLVGTGFMGLLALRYLTALGTAWSSSNCVPAPGNSPVTGGRTSLSTLMRSTTGCAAPSRS